MSHDRSYLSALRSDPYLRPFESILDERLNRLSAAEKRLTQNSDSLCAFANGYNYFGLHRDGSDWVFREWAPNATAIFLVGEMSNWQERAEYALSRLPDSDTWQLQLPGDHLRHEMLYRLRVHWDGGSGDRIPSYASRVCQDAHTHIFNAQVWDPSQPYQWQHTPPPPPPFPTIYESHVGMALEHGRVGTYIEFRTDVLPRIVEAGYNTLQLMAVMEHPYFGSFGYHVANFFAPTSRCGTPDELKELIDAAHGTGLTVIMDIVHSHCVRNEVEGLSRFDGTEYQYFHAGRRGYHDAWNSRCFDYGKLQVLHFLLSNCRFWINEYKFDGYRFDGVTSMLYLHHGFGPPFSDYSNYFDSSVDGDAVAYLALANRLIHSVNPNALTIAEDVSGMPGLAAPIEAGGCGFDFRLAMGVPDCWFKLFRDTPDEDWHMGNLWHELTNRRADEQTISYVECHDQSIVGSKTAIFELIDAEMYEHMGADDNNMRVERGMSIHKLSRLATIGTAGHGYLNFIGNEFGHPEWVDFPREGNNWSHHYARRQWHLRDDPALKYHFLADFDRAMLDLVTACPDYHTLRPELIMVHESDSLLVFRRGELMFLFNFNPSHSAVNQPIPTRPGKYRVALSSDAPQFGGQDRIATSQVFEARQEDDGTFRIKVYLPCRTAMVLQPLGT